MNLNNNIIKDLILSGNGRSTCSIQRVNFVSELLLFKNEMFDEDINSFHTGFKNSITSLIVNKYIDLIRPYPISKRCGIYMRNKSLQKGMKYITDRELLELKKRNYHIIRDYYNNEIIPVIQQLNDHPENKYNVYPVVGYKFKPLKDRSHLII